MKRAPIGILSDSHDNRDGIRLAVEAFNTAGCGHVLHAGDFIAPFTAREFSKLACPLIGVYGNNDGERKGLAAQFSKFGELHTGPYEFTLAGLRIVLMHEPDNLDSFAARSDVDLVVYGHLHEVDIRPGKPLIINPGECCSWLSGKSTIVMLDPVTLEPELVTLN